MEGSDASDDNTKEEYVGQHLITGDGLIVRSDRHAPSCAKRLERHRDMTDYRVWRITQ